MSGLYSIVGDDPIFHLTEHPMCLILALVADPTQHSYESKQHEYNRIYRMLDNCGTPYLLFDFGQSQVLDPIMIGILVELTNRSRILNGNAALTCMSPETSKIFTRLMRLQPINKRVSWEIYNSIPEALTACPWHEAC